MKPTYIFITAVFATILTFTSCEDNDIDNTQPVITIGEPANGETLYIGSDVHFECDFSDDVELRSYKIEIHSNFDGHTHEKSASFSADEETPFSYTNSWTFDEGLKNAHVHHHEIVIPENINGIPVAHGNYHFGIYCTDAAGNESHLFIDVALAEGEGEHEHE